MSCWWVSSCSPHPPPQVDPAHKRQEHSQSGHDKCEGKTQICCLGEDKITYPAGITGAWQQCMEGDKGRNGGELEMIASQVSAGRGWEVRPTPAARCGKKWKSGRESFPGKESTCVLLPCLQLFQSSSAHRQSLSLWQSLWDTKYAEVQPNSRGRKAFFCHFLSYCLASEYVLCHMN